MFPICFFIFCLGTPSVIVPDGSGGFVPYTNSRVMSDGSLRPYDPSIDEYPVVVARSDVYNGPPVIEDPNGNTVLISPSGRPTDMVYPPRYEYYPQAPSYERPQRYERRRPAQVPQAYYEKHTAEHQAEHRHSHVRTMTEPEFDKSGKWVDPNPTPPPGSLCDPTLEQC